MNRQQEQATQPITLPAGVMLEDLVAAVTRGVTEALAAQDDVRGFTFGPIQLPLVLTTVVYCPVPPPQDPRRPHGPIFEQGIDRGAC